jgi:hypothetical protein
VFTGRTRVNSQHNFASNSFAVVRQALTVHIPTWKYQTAARNRADNISGHINCLSVIKQLKLRQYRIQAVLTTKYGCRNLTLPLVSVFFASKCSCTGQSVVPNKVCLQLSDYINSQNSRMLRPVPQTPLHSLKTDVWYAVFRKPVLGPLLFEERGENGFRITRSNTYSCPPPKKKKKKAMMLST